MNPHAAALRKGFLAGLAAYGLWGLVPLYFKTLPGVPAEQILAHRILWSAVVLTVLVTATGGWTALTTALRPPRIWGLLLGSTVMIGANWYLYIYSVQTAQVVQSSLGYFIIPLVNVVLGLVFFRERLRGPQWLAVALAGVGVGWLVWSDHAVPWLAVSLAGTFSCYGLLRKTAGVPSVTGLTVETLLLVFPALLWLAWVHSAGTGSFGRLGWQTDGLLLALGVVTTAPLLCFGTAARLLPLSLLGFLQYISPTVQFLLAVIAFEEPVGERLPGFVCIWTGLAVFTVDSVVAYRRQAAVAEFGKSCVAIPERGQ